MYHHLMTWRLLPNEKLGLPGNSDVKMHAVQSWCTTIVYYCNNVVNVLFSYIAISKLLASSTLYFLPIY